MGYFSELDLKLRQYLPDDVDNYIPCCPHCGGRLHIIGFVPPKTLHLACLSCARHFQHEVQVKAQAMHQVDRS